jgi:glycosyltransferase involved in cell wall biosynthesis
MRHVVIIPAFKPDEGLLKLSEQLLDSSQNIIVINDGSGVNYEYIFKKLEQKGITVLKHAVNLGKGTALKTAFNYVLTQYPNASGVITADADGQHHPEDILKIANKLNNDPKTLWLGARIFDGKVPLRSRFGNVMTRMVYRLFVAQNLQDTQTGLRGIPLPFLRCLLKSNTNGYDFELDMLIMAAKRKINISEMNIRTIYEDNNKSSHFNPIKDSLKIYFVFFRFLFFSLICGLLDFLFFSLAFMLFGQIFISEGIARVLSGSINFFWNKRLVFKSKQSTIPEALRYILLCLVNLVFSYGLISSLVFFGLNVHASKLLALLGLFIANFAIQKLMIFGREESDYFEAQKSTS